MRVRLERWRMRTMGGMRARWRMMPGTAFVKAPARKAAKVNFEPVRPRMTTSATPQTARPASMAATREA